MSAATTPVLSPVRVVNHITGSTHIMETRRDRADLWFDLAGLLRLLNRRGPVKASAHLLPDWIIVQLHCDGRRLNDLAKQGEVVESVDKDMLRYVEELVLREGGQPA